MGNGIESTGGIGPQISGLERPQQALQSLLAGNVTAAWDAMLQPGELSPKDKDAFIKKLGIKDTIYENVVQAMTNPALIISLLLSYKFPVAIGASLFKIAKEVGGMTGRLPILGRLASPIAIFRGTDVPETLMTIAGNRMEFRKKFDVLYGEVLGKFQTATNRLPTHQEQVLVSAYLDGLHESTKGYAGRNGKVVIGAGANRVELEGVKALMPGLEQKMAPELLELAKGTRGVLDQQWEHVFGQPENRRFVARALKRLQKEGLIDEGLQAFIDDPKKLAHYFPHRVLQNEEDFRSMVKALTQSGSSRQFARNAQGRAVEWITPEVQRRQFAMVPDAQDLAAVADFVDQGELKKLQEITKAQLLNGAQKAGMRTRTVDQLRQMPLQEMLSEYGKVLQPAEASAFSASMLENMPRSYSLKLMPVINSYNHTLAGTYAWTAKGGGEKMRSMVDEAKAAAQLGDARAKWRSEYLENTILPQAMGRGTFRQSIKAQLWDQGMARVGASLEEGPIRTLLGDKTADVIAGHLKNSRGAMSFMNVQAKAAGYFYMSTLGLNVGSSLTNMLQTLLTTGPTLGFRTTAEGLGEAMRKSHKYFALRLGKRALDHEGALAAAYPEFAKAGLVSAPITAEVIENTLQNAYNVARLPSKATKLYEKLSRAMLSTFTASETSNRLIAFEAGMIHARRGGLGIDDAIAHARRVVETTQFPAGVHNRPAFVADLPPLLGQFLNFPMKMLEFATSTAMTAGSAGKNVFGYNPGTFARMIAGSVIAMELGDTLGVDLRGGLLSGALPMPEQPSDRRLFGAFPIVPPFLQLTGSAAVGAATGDWGALAASTPLLVPGGIQAFKVAGLLPPQVPGAGVGQSLAKAFERTYADYDQPAPDGRIAVYSGKGTFRGYYTPWEITKYGLGVKGGDLDKEQALLQMVTKGRNKIAEAKVSYVDARFRNNATEANKIASNFKQEFGFQLPVSSRDMKALQTRRTVSRLEQLIRTMPAGEARNQAIQVLSATMGADAPQLLGVDPAMLGQPRPAAQASRFGGTPSGFSQRNPFNPQTDLGPQDTVNPSTIGRQPGINRVGQPF
jgi:hypothetical protein